VLRVLLGRCVVTVRTSVSAQCALRGAREERRCVCDDLADQLDKSTPLSRVSADPECLFDYL
jgi:HEAT repeat protein